MYDFLNNFLNSNYFDKLPRYISRRIFKIFKIFFVETKLKSLPDNNHPNIIDEETQNEIVKKNTELFNKPFNTCPYLLEILAVYYSFSEEIKILDFGANNIDNFIYLKKYLKNLQYFYHDLPENNSIIEKLIKKNNWDDIKVAKDIANIDQDLDFAFFGSSIHYVKDYKIILEKIFKKKIKYLIFSHTPFYKSVKNDKDIVMKQVNIHPIINYAYLIELNNFLKFMDDNGYNLISSSQNNLIKFLNFKNFKNFNYIGFLDLIFVAKK